MNSNKEHNNLKDNKIGILGIVVISIIAIDSLRNLPQIAPMGLMAIPLFLLGALTFMFPTAVAASELSSRWPLMGGISVWVRQAFGKNWSFIIVWIQWIYNILWFPLITAFAATHLFYGIGAIIGYDTFKGVAIISLNENNIAIACICIILFWLATAINCLGIKKASILSGIATIIGTLMPMGLIILLACIWVFNGNTTQLIQDSSIYEQFTTNFKSSKLLSLYVILLFSLLGLEISSAHAGQVENPRKNYPKALWLATVIIPLSLILTVIAMGVFISPDSIEARTGLIHSFIIFLTYFNLEGLISIISFAIFIGAFGTMGAWSFGIARYLKKITELGFLPKFLGKNNKYGVPQNAMIFQGIVVSLLSFSYALLPTIQYAYLFLSMLVGILAVGAYIAFFAATIKLRSKYKWIPNVHYTFGPKWLVYTIYTVGIIGSSLGVITGFIDPDIEGGTSIINIIIGILIVLIIPAVIIFFQQVIFKKNIDNNDSLIDEKEQIY